MSVQLKFKDDTTSARRREIVEVLARAGFSARSLFPGQQRAKLASMYTITEAEPGDMGDIASVLAPYDRDIDFVEAAPERGLKG